MTSVVTEKGQTTVPKAIREALGLSPGTVLAWEAGALASRVSKAKPAGKRAQPLRSFYSSVRGRTNWEPAKMPDEAPRQVEL